MLLNHGAPVSMVWNSWYLAPMIRKQANLLGLKIHDTCVYYCYVHVFLHVCICSRRVYAQARPHNTLYFD